MNSDKAEIIKALDEIQLKVNGLFLFRAIDLQTQRFFTERIVKIRKALGESEE